MIQTHYISFCTVIVVIVDVVLWAVRQAKQAWRGHCTHLAGTNRFVSSCTAIRTTIQEKGDLPFGLFG
jgi:hypothetical protein